MDKNIPSYLSERGDKLQTKNCINDNVGARWGRDVFMEEMSRPVRTGRKTVSSYGPNSCHCRKTVETRRVGNERGLLERIVRKKTTWKN
jgi:hypothetical protein